MNAVDELVRFPGVGVLREAPEQELSPDALAPYEAAAAEFSDLTNPLVDRINEAIDNPGLGRPHDVPGYLGPERIDLATRAFQFTVEKDGVTYEAEALRTYASEDQSLSNDWLTRRAGALMDGKGIERLSQLVAVDRERGIIIKTAVPGKDVADLSVPAKLRIKSEHIEELSHTLVEMRERNLSIRSVHDLRYSRKTGFYFNDYEHPDFTSSSDIDTNVVSFLNYALADWQKLESYSDGRAMGVPRSCLPKPETTGLLRAVRNKVLGRAATVPFVGGPFEHYYDESKPLPAYQPSPELLDVVKLNESAAPAGAARFVRGSIHVVRRDNGVEGYQVVNEMNDGVSVAALEVVLGHAYLIMVDQMRYPHTRPGDEGLNIEQAARLRRAGRWSRELVSGGVEAFDVDLAAAAAREAREEAGIFGLEAENMVRLYPQLLSSISVNHQPFNLFAAEIGRGMWIPEAVVPDIEEGDLRVNAYRLDTTVPEMIANGTIVELSAVTAIAGLHNTRWRKYMS